MNSVRWERGKEANKVAGMRPCSDREGRGVEVLDWQEEGRLSIGQEASGVQEVVERALRDEKGRSSDAYREWDNRFRICHKLQGWAPTEKRQDVSRRYKMIRNTRLILKRSDLQDLHKIAHGLRCEFSSLGFRHVSAHVFDRLHSQHHVL